LLQGKKSSDPRETTLFRMVEGAVERRNIVLPGNPRQGDRVNISISRMAGASVSTRQKKFWPSEWNLRMLLA